MMQEGYGPDGQPQQQNYYDSIETDEFVMPNKFEVEIRLADNQVSLKASTDSIIRSKS